MREELKEIVMDIQFFGEWQGDPSEIADQSVKKILALLANKMPKEKLSDRASMNQSYYDQLNGYNSALYDVKLSLGLEEK